MKRKINFAVLRYIPNYDRKESINVGVVLHSAQDKYMKIKLISNFKRLQEFDDELDISFIKVYFKSLEESFTYGRFDTGDINIENATLLEELTRFYVNQFKFDYYDSYEIETDCDSFLESLQNNFLYYDIKKDERISQKESSNFFEGLLRSKNIEYEKIKTKNSLFGKYKEKINVDFKIDEKYYKLINFDDSNVVNYIPTIKMWMINAMELNEMDKKLIFVVNELIRDDKTELFIKMLSQHGEVVRMSELDEYF